MTDPKYWTLAACLTVLLGSALYADDSAANAKYGQKIANVSFKDKAGKTVSLADFKDQKAVVVVFLSFDCPVSNSYSQPLAEMAKAYGDKGVAFIGVCNDDGDAAQIDKLARDYHLPFPVYKDQGQALADAFKANLNPEAFVLDRHGILRYRGRIDNAYSARLKKNQQTTRHDLRQAVDELLAGKPVSEPVTTAIGCPIVRETKTTATGKVTYHRDVAPILQNRCQGCHRPGEVGPFALMTYKQAVNWAGDIKDYTQAHKMPPWKPTEGVAFHNERKMSDKEIATLVAWVDGGTPEGDPHDAPSAKQWIEGWQLGQPDLVLSPAEDFQVGASGRDAFRVFVMPTNLPADAFVTAVEVRPGNPRVVHHTLNFIDTTGAARKLEQKEKERAKSDDEQDKGPGYSMAMGVGFLPQGGLGGWAPGQMGRHLPDGYGFKLPKGADVVVQVHYHRNGRVEKDRLQIGLFLAKKTGLKQMQGAVIRGNFLYVPAGQQQFKVTGSLPPLAQDIVLHSVMPHMHMLGKEIKVTARPLEGPPQTLIAIKEWEYNWQETYFLKTPLLLKTGTKLEVEAIYDNSADNPNNPFSPPRPVRFGEQTDNEMCFVFLGATSDTPGRLRFEGRRDTTKTKGN
jgi:peroxiredoxin